MAGSLKDLSEYRLGRCFEELENSKMLLDAGKYKLSLNRSYYSIFHGMRAVNVLDGFDSSKHSGVIELYPHPKYASGTQKIQH